MRSSSGSHFIALDHIRAVAAFLVVSWHFLHSTNGTPIEFGSVPFFGPLSFLNEGHTGVAVFMTLSGYLFAKLLDGRDFSFPSFLWNRTLRLLPRLSFVILIVLIQKYFHGESLQNFAISIVQGIFLPTLPNGGWSITVEFHFYLILPFLLYVLKTKPHALSLAIISTIGIRAILYQFHGEVQSLAYWTIFGRIDQFIFGILSFKYRRYISGRNFIALLIFLFFTFALWYFNFCGGFYHFPAYPSSSPVWIFLPAIEGFSYGAIISWYDNSKYPKDGPLSNFWGRVGEYSYSIYLLHIFFVFSASSYINEIFGPINSIFIGCLWSVVFFLAMIPIAHVSYTYFEKPFLKHRKQYIQNYHN